MSGIAAFIANMVGSVAPSLIPLFSHGFKGIKGAFQSMSDATTGAHLTGAQQEANAFSAEQAQRQMDFQQQMSNTAYQRGVVDMKAAGVNPALVYGSAANGASTPAGAMATSTAPSTPDFVGMLGQIANLRLLGAQRRNIEANTKNLLEQANKAKEEAILTKLKQNFQEQVNEWYPYLSQNTLDIGAAEIARAYSERDVNVESLDDIQASVALKDSQRAINEIEAEWIPRLREAQEKGQLASAAADYARAAYDRYVTGFAASHNGQMPGFNSAFGMFTAVTGEIQKLFGSNADLPSIIGEAIAKAVESYKNSQNNPKGKNGKNSTGGR